MCVCVVYSFSHCLLNAFVYTLEFCLSFPGSVLLQIERNLQDALHVARNIRLKPSLVPGGGAFEMALQQVCSYLTVPSFVFSSSGNVFRREHVVFLNFFFFFYCLAASMRY